MPIITILFELIYIIFFGLIVYSNYKQKHRRTIMELFSIATFALTLEYLSIKTYDAYQYSPDFILQFGKKPDNVPIVIALAWAIIIGVSMKISDATKVNKQAKPFLDTLLALTIDLSMDVIAIRIEKGLWNWKIELSNSISFDSFIGVRYGNFIGWYFIVLIFSMMIRFGRDRFWLSDRNYGYYLSIIPFLSFIPFYICFEAIQQGKKIFNFAPYFMVVVVILVIIAIHNVLNNYEQQKLFPESKLLHIELKSFYSFHLFFLIAFFALGMHRNTPMILIPSVIAIIIHYMTHLLLIEDRSISQKIIGKKISIGK